MSYHFCEPSSEHCDECGDLAVCQVLADDSCESETGYQDTIVLCDDCWRERLLRESVR